MIQALAIAASLLFSPLARAETLRWQDCVAEAQAHNPELKAAEKELEAAGYSVKGSRAGFFPSVSASLGYGRSGSMGKNESADSAYSATLSASQNIFNGFADKARVSQARAQAEASYASLLATRSSVSYDLRSAFAQILFAQESTKLADEIVRRREDNLSLVRLRFQNGAENKGSVLLSQANLDQAKLDALSARSSLEAARTALAKVLGRDKPGDLAVEGDSPISLPAQVPDFSAIALGTPNYLQSLATEKSANASVTLAKSGFFPSLELSGSRSRNGTEGFYGNDQWGVGLTLSVPLFSGGRDYYGTKSAVETRDAAALKRENQAREEESRLSAAYANLKVAVEKVSVSTSFADAAQVRATIARQKYNNGLLSFEDWDGIENDLINRQKNLIESQRDRITAAAAWEQAQGVGVI